MSTIPHPSIDSTILLAAKLHRGQRDKAGVPYIAHPLAVMRLVPERSWHVAVLHDVMEDCGVTPGRLVSFGYAEEEIAALCVLTRRRREHLFCGACLHEHVAGVTTACLVINCNCEAVRDETYREFIERIATSGNEIAIEVKIVDLRDNLDIKRPSIDEPPSVTARRRLQYDNALARLMACDVAERTP